MNGVHDLGGMHGFGPVIVEQNEPVFHARWEAIVAALMTRSLSAVFNLDEMRYATERIPAARYLDASYYERWLAAMETLLVEKAVIDHVELEARELAIEHDASMPLPSNRPAVRPAPNMPKAPQVTPRFWVGERVRTRNMHPAGHTRLPRYARAKTGTVRSVNGPFLLPDARAQGLAERWEPVYAVEFPAHELWGAGDHLVCVDLWESYLETEPHD